MDQQQLTALRSASEQTGNEGDTQDSSKREAEAQVHRDLLATVLDSGARERLARIALVSPSRSQQIEGILLRMAQSGQLRGRVTEQQLIGLLEQAILQAESAQTSTTAKGPIVYQRRQAELEDDDDWNFGL
ncbi:DNA-binding TFAR19-related protein [Hysterangium stoloniferum]|nr:DNA-binding TFAR19-related protein [Hysterangium stoloniferum]